MPKDCWAEEFAKVLRTGTENERAAIAEKLVDLGNDVALVMLVSALPQEKSAYVRRKIISLLGAKKDVFVANLVMPLLSAEQAHVRGMAREILVKLGSIAVEGLADQMLSDSRDVRKQAVDVLAEIPGEAPFELLLEGLADADSVVVAGCADALGKRGDARAVTTLSKCLRTFPATWVGFSIIQALNALGDVDNIAVMNEYIASVKTAGDRTVLAGAWAEAVGRACRADALPQAWEFYQEGILSAEAILQILSRVQQGWPELDQGNSALHGLLVKTLQEGGGEILLDAAGLAARYAPKAFAQQLPQLVGKIARDERFAQSDVMELLVRIVLSAGLSSQDMYPLLNGGHESAIGLALAVAEAGSDPLSIAELTAAYRNAGPENAARLLRLAARSGSSALCLYDEVLSSESNAEVISGALAGAAALLGDCATPLFCRAILHPATEVRKVAMDTLIQKMPPGVGEILRRQFADTCMYAWPEILAVLSAFNTADLVAVWQQAARIEDGDARVRLAAAMGYIRDENLYLSVAKTLVNDPEAAVRRMVITSLSRRSGEKVWKLLSYLYENDPEKKHRCHILACHEVWNHTQGFDWLKENLAEPDCLLQSAAVRGLVGLGAKGMQALDEALRNRPDDERLREMVDSV